MTKKVLIGTAIALALVVTYLVGSSLTGRPAVLTWQATADRAVETPVTSAGGHGYSGATTAGKDALEVAPEEQRAGQSTAAAERMVVRTASMQVRVENIDEAISSLRRAAARSGGMFESLSRSVGEPPIQPYTQSGAPGSDAPSGPAYATVVIRVPAKNLTVMLEQASKLGVVLSESQGESDVTAQYVDLNARLKNLRAEEARLRSLFERAAKVPDLLAVERELSRVRGEIESLVAQIDVLERQVDLATLTVDLQEPGSVISPSGDDWGFRDAVTRGIRGAVAVLTTMITGMLALAPLLVLAGLGWWIVRFARGRRRAHAGDTDRPQASGTVEPQTGDTDAPEA